MIPVSEAYSIIDRVVKVNQNTVTDLKSCPGYFLAEDISSYDNIPINDNSAMDGYAVRCKDLETASTGNPVRLEVIDEVPAGRVSGMKTGHGQAIRIMTGGAVPEGADAVVKVEDTEEYENTVEISYSPSHGENIRLCGEDLKNGEKVFSKGHLIRPADAGLLASIGITDVPVFRKPEAALLTTGDEVIPPEEELEPGKVRNSNLYSLSGFLRELDIDSTELPVGRDSRDDLQKSIEKGLDSDILITSGAVSVGKYDILKSVLKDMGLKEHFWRVRQKPGKPLLFGALENTLVFGLPGNPVSVTVTFLMYVRTAILKMMGSPDPMPKRLRATMQKGYEKTAGLTHFIRGKYEIADTTVIVTPYDSQGSGILRSMSMNNCLIILDEKGTSFPEGSKVDIVPY